MTRFVRGILVLVTVAVPITAAGQESAPEVAAPPTASAPALAGSRYWFVTGSGFASVRAGCATCDREGVYTNSRTFLIDVGLRINPRVDAGVELMWVGLKVGREDPVRTTFVLGVAQMRPWANRGLFLRAGMGVGIAGNGLSGPIGALEPPYTTNALALTYGTGWVFRPNHRFALQVYASHHVAALGTLTTASGSTVQSVVGNYWTVGAAIAIR